MADIDEQQLLDEVQPEAGFDSIIVVDGLPVVDQDKYEKLVNVVRKIFSQIGAIRENGLYMPKDAKGATKGFAFIEFSTPEEASMAVQQTNGYKLDKNHIFKVNSYNDLNKFLSVPDEYTPPQQKPYEPRDNLRFWLSDGRGRDQFVIRYADECEIFWNDPTQKLEQVYSRRFWTESYVSWSPLGTYLATFHRQGIVLWGGPSWAKQMRFNHPGVKLIDFSPKENYLVTWNNQERDDPKDPQSIIIWEIRTGRKLRGFLGVKEGTSPSWPVFKWSHDDKYFARLGEDGIAVYEAPSMKLLDKKLKMDGARDFCWSPSDNIMAAWQPEFQNSPARVTLIELPSKQEIRQKNLFNVTDIKMHWQSDGDYLCVKVDRHTKTKKSTYTNFEFFRMRDKDIPIEVLEIKENIVAFSWEPKGMRFALIHGEGARADVSFYTMENPKGGKVRLLKTLDKKPANHLFWSPQGGYICLAGLKALNGVLEFFNVNEMETMATEEHFMATDVEWDPTGRYCCTFVSHWRHQMENGFIIWGFNGKTVHKIMKDKFYQLLWRPRPPSLLSAEQEKLIRKNLHDYSKRYAAEDEDVRKTQATDIAKFRDTLRDSWETYARQKAVELAEERELRRQIRGGALSDDEGDYEIVETVEEIADVTEEILLA
eukprot:tig00020848_g14590.t1